MIINDRCLNFEKKIAYFYGAKDVTPIWEAYQKAISELPKDHRKVPENVLQKRMLPHLEDAYESIYDQTDLLFHIHEAAKLEFQMIYGYYCGRSVEHIRNVQNELYQCVLNSDSKEIYKATRLRVFLYQYIQKNEINEDDRKLLINISDRSKEILNRLISGVWAARSIS